MDGHDNLTRISSSLIGSNLASLLSLAGSGPADTSLDHSTNTVLTIQKDDIVIVRSECSRMQNKSETICPAWRLFNSFNFDDY